MDIRLKENEGTHSTSLRINLSVICAVPIQVIGVVVPLGRLTEQFVLDLIEERNEGLQIV